MYRDYIHSVVDHPAFVGCAWFEYVDEPLTGRAYDGENYNIGFVTITDTPYPEMVEAAKTVHAEAYARRLGR
jgi:agarase